MKKIVYILTVISLISVSLRAAEMPGNNQPHPEELTSLPNNELIQRYHQAKTELGRAMEQEKKHNENLERKKQILRKYIQEMSKRGLLE